MLLGARSNGVIGDSILQRAIILKEHDYDFMELVLTENDLGAYNAEWVKEMNRISNTAQLPMLTLSLSCVRRLGEASEEELSLYALRLENAVRYAVQFGAYSILVASVEATADVEALLPNFRRVFLPAADLARSRAVTLCLEPVAAYSNAALSRLARALDHPSVRIYYDMGNCINAKEDPVEQAWEYGDVIGAVHVKGIHDYELLDMPLSGVLAALSYHRYDRTACIETSAQEGNAHLPEAMLALTALGYR